MKGRKNNKTVGLLAVLLALGLSMGVVGTAVAQVEIPAGATIDSATLSVYATEVNSQTVNVHQITADWQEMVVTWGNFGGNYAAPVVGSFVADTVGWYSIDVTDLVLDWANGTVPNYGVLLEQGSTPLTMYASSEYATVDMRPKLEIAYTVGGTPSSITIQRPGTEQDGVADAYIWQSEEYPNWQRGDAPELYTGLWWNGGDKQALIRFGFIYVPPGVGTGTPGYWKNHPDAWPVDEITIGGITYTKADAIAYMDTPDAGDKTFTMFRALVAAKLNVEIGNESGCVDATIAAADAWMSYYPAGSGVKAGGKTSPWREGDPLYDTLDDYNNGLLCAPSRDDLE